MIHSAMITLAVVLAILIVLLTLWLWRFVGTRSESHAFAGRIVTTIFILAFVTYLVLKLLTLTQLRVDLFSEILLLFYFFGEIFTFAFLVHGTWDSLGALEALSKNAISPVEAFSDRPQPHVTIHVPISNESVEVVTSTLRSLQTLDYPSYDVIVLDNNTEDEALWEPIRLLCAQLGFDFEHVEHVEGFKAGALNRALLRTCDQSEIVAVIDADYIVEPEFLRETTPYFVDPTVAWVQTAQRYRNENANFFTRQFTLYYRQFFTVSLVARTQRNSGIFAGTMGLIRRSVLEQVGGWSDWALTEDAELSLRMLAAGYHGIYLPRHFGTGLMPETFIDSRRQWYRWIFGGTQILVQHLATLLKPERIKLTFWQRLDFIVGGVMALGAWLFIASSIGIAALFATISLLDPMGERFKPLYETIDALAATLLFYHVLIFLDAVLVSCVTARLSEATTRRFYTLILSYYSLSSVFARAFVKALLRRPSAFIRTPKVRVEYPLLRGLREVQIEVSLIFLLLSTMAMLLVRVPVAHIPVSLFWVALLHIAIYVVATLPAFVSLPHGHRLDPS